AVSMQLKVLREHGFANVRPDGTRRIYSLDTGPMAEVDAWLTPFRRFWTQHLDALDTEIRRGRRLGPPTPKTQSAADSHVTRSEPDADQ
ncbi:MAG: helix-turn-helix domain-containing protein, partial [Actinomycetota bacterium]|nr:helix-turn-helix domain-containing protein [Actinomycetota bacterium]